MPSATIRIDTATVAANNLTLDAKQTTCTGELLVKGAFAFESGMTGKGGAGGAGGATIKIDGGADVPSDEQFAKMKSRGGRPKLARPKVSLTIPYDADVVEHFKAGCCIRRICTTG